MSDSVQPHRRQPTRLPCPWDSPGKNTGVGCHFLLQCMKVKSESEVTQLCLTVCNPMACSLPGSPIHGIFQARVLEWGTIAFSGQTDYSSLKQLPSFLFPDPLCVWNFFSYSFNLLTNSSLIPRSPPSFPPGSPFPDSAPFLPHVKSCTLHLMVFYFPVIVLFQSLFFPPTYQRKGQHPCPAISTKHNVWYMENTSKY